MIVCFELMKEEEEFVRRRVDEYARQGNSMRPDAVAAGLFHRGMLVAKEFESRDAPIDATVSGTHRPDASNDARNSLHTAG
jgi:hypothetical protein